MPIVARGKGGRGSLLRHLGGGAFHFPFLVVPPVYGHLPYHGRYFIATHSSSNGTVQARHGTITCVTGLRGTCPTDSGEGRGR